MAKKHAESKTQNAVSSPVSEGYNYSVKIQNLTEEEKAKYLALTEKINSRDLTTITNYGAELNEVVAKNGDKLLSSVRSDSGGEIVELVTDLMKQLNIIDIDKINSNSKLRKMLSSIPVLNKLVTSVENIKVKYNDVLTNVTEISKKMSDAKLVAMKDNSTLQEIFDNNVIYIERIRELIIGAQLLIENSTAELSQMVNEQEKYESYEISEMQDFVNQLDKRVSDMKVIEATLEQNLLQIKATQGNNIAIAQKSDNIITNVLPLWKNQLAIALIINNQSENVKAQALLTETTNKMLAENAKKLHSNSVAVAKANEESVISVETLKTTTEELISTIKEVQQIHLEGAQDRKMIESEIENAMNQLSGVINQITYENK